MNDTAVEIENGSFSLMLGVKMRRCVVVKVHTNDNPVKNRDDRHRDDASRRDSLAESYTLRIASFKISRCVK